MKVGIAEVVRRVRAIVGIEDDTPGVTEIESRLALWIGMLEKNEAEQTSLKKELSVSVLDESSNLGKTQRHRLEKLVSERGGLLVGIEGLREALIDARNREKVASTERQWRTAKDLGADFDAAAMEAVEATTALGVKLKKLLVAGRNFVDALPERLPLELEPTRRLSSMIPLRLQHDVPGIFGPPNAILSAVEVERAADITAAVHEFVSMAMAPATHRSEPNPATRVLTEETTNA